MTKSRFHATTSLVLINALVFLWQYTTGNPGNAYSDVLHGAFYGPLVLRGEWWRLITAAFLHGGVLHLGMNMIALANVGSPVEQIYGPKRFLAIYFFAALSGTICDLLFGYTQVSLGASGAIYGLFGALVAIGLRLGPPGRRLIKAVFPVIAINFLLTFALPFIDRRAHLGGFFGGLLLSALLYRKPVTVAAPFVEESS